MKLNGVVVIVSLCLFLAGCPSKKQNNPAPPPQSPQSENNDTGLVNASAVIRENRQGVEFLDGEKALEFWPGAKIVDQNKLFTVIEKSNRRMFVFYKSEQLGEACGVRCDIKISENFVSVQRRRGKTQLFLAGTNSPISECEQRSCRHELGDQFAVVNGEDGKIEIFNHKGERILNLSNVYDYDVEMSSSFVAFRPPSGGLLFHKDSTESIFNCRRSSCEFKLTDGFALVQSQFNHFVLFNNKGHQVFEIMEGFATGSVEFHLTNVFASYESKVESILFHRNSDEELHACRNSYVAQGCDIYISDTGAHVYGQTHSLRFNTKGHRIN